MSLSERGLRKQFLPTGEWAENGGSPILLTFEPSGEGDGTEIAWAERGSRKALGRYNFCPHLDTLIEGINQALMVNDGIGMGGEAVIKDANRAIEATRYRLGNCVVKPLFSVVEGVIAHHHNDSYRATLWTPEEGIITPEQTES